MALFNPRIYPEILGEMIARLTAVTPLSDINFGSVWTSMLEAAAQEDDEQYFQMLEIIRAFSLDSTTGQDLDDRAFEFGITRLSAQTATTIVTLGDSAFTKISTGIYSGLPGPASGSNTVNGDNLTGFDISGTIIIGRGTPNAETVPYGTITDNGNYVTFNLSASLANDHGTDESIVLANGGNRLINAGTVVVVPAGDITPQIEFTLDDDATLDDGEDSLPGVAVTAAEAGADSNVPIGAIITFDSPPFSTATVINPARVTNGTDEETDQELRDRIKDTIQSLSRGTGQAIITGVVGVISEEENKRVVSASLIEPTIPADVVKLFIDDGTGFIPLFNNIGFETVVTSATGGEKFLKTTNFPIVKAFAETQFEEPFALNGGETLFVEVGGAIETVTFESTDFAIPGVATAQEVLTKLNSSASLYEARVSSGGIKVRIFSRGNFDEQIRVVGGTANPILNFPTDLKFTTKLYLKRDNITTLLNKDGITATIESGNTAAYNMDGFDHNWAVVVDGKEELQYVNFPYLDFVNPLNVTAQEIVDLIAAQVSGINAFTSSEDTRISLRSKTERSALSSIKIIDNFSGVKIDAGGFTDITTEARTVGSDVQVFAADSDYVYFGHGDVKFSTIFFNPAIPASAPMGFIAEFWNGTSWVSFGLYDGSDGFTQAGILSFFLPLSWAQNVVDGTTAYWVRLQRVDAGLVTPPTESEMRITSANEIFGFSDFIRTGQDKDYTINRFIGQIELVSPLQPFDQVTLGSFETQASMVSNTGPYGLVGGETLDIEVDGVPQTITFQAGDFFTPGAALVQEVADRIIADGVGIFTDVVNFGTQIRITSNKINGGTIRAIGGTANAFLLYSTDLVEALAPHVGSIESGSASPYAFAIDDTVIMVIDQNGANSFTVPCFREGATQAGTTISLIKDVTLITQFPTDVDLDTDWEVEIKDGAFAGERQDIASYSAITGEITLAAPLSGVPLDGTVYQIFPKTAEKVSELWNNRQITLITTEAQVNTSSGGTKVQISSNIAGEASGVEVAGGTGNTTLNFSIVPSLGADGYRYFTGLMQQTQWTVDGREDLPDTYPGIRAAGVQVEVIEPVRKPQRVEVDITPREGVTLASISNEIKTAVSAYINTLPVGGDVIISEITVATKGVSGVFDSKVNFPLENAAIADSELARIAESAIIVG